MIRVTTNGTLNTYRSNLTTSNVTLNKARDTVLTQRNFNSFSEDPASATQAFQLRRSWHRTDSQYTACQSTIRKFNVGWQTLDSVEEMLDTTTTSAHSASLAAANDPTGSGRQALGTELEQMADSIVQTLNAKYGDNFVFSGSDGETVPFTWSDSGDLLYRGVNVSSTDANDQAALKALANEKNFVDIGIGMEEDENGKLIESSAFNDNLQGINYLGYGLDEENDPQNIAVIIKQMSECLGRCDDSGNWQGDDEETFNRLLGKLETASSELKTNYAQLDAKASFLETQSTQLETTADTLNEEFLEIEQCDLADAITSYSWAQYCYNAALKVGNSILSQSLIDYLS
jgi:flagellar hook-associated protein 3 FlgL